MSARRSSLMLIWKYNIDSSSITRVVNSFEFFLFFIILPIFRNRVFLLTCPASMQICWEKRKPLRTKRFKLSEDWFGTQKYGRHDVMWKHSIVTAPVRVCTVKGKAYLRVALVSIM